MRPVFLFFVVLAVWGCAPQRGARSQEQAPRGKPYAKVDISTLALCREDRECAPPATYCISLPSDLGRCYTTAQMQEYIGCTRGDPILLFMQPWLADCL